MSAIAYLNNENIHVFHQNEVNTCRQQRSY